MQKYKTYLYGAMGTGALLVEIILLTADMVLLCIYYCLVKQL